MRLIFFSENTGFSVIRDINFIIPLKQSSIRSIERNGSWRWRLVTSSRVDFCNMQINWPRHSWRLSVNCELQFQITRCWGSRRKILQDRVEPCESREENSREPNHDFAWSYDEMRGDTLFAFNDSLSDAS